MSRSEPIVWYVVGLFGFGGPWSVSCWAWGRLEELIRQPCSADEISRVRAFVLLFVLQVSATAPVALFLGIARFGPENGGWSTGVFLLAVMVVLALASAGGLTVRGWQFRYLIRWTRKQLGHHPIL